MKTKTEMNRNGEQGEIKKKTQQTNQEIKEKEKSFTKF